jgi:hypothetical protein
MSTKVSADHLDTPLLAASSFALAFFSGQGDASWESLDLISSLGYSSKWRSTSPLRA